ncbi:hypothetical protein BaOVIS_023210 [Babesia ovis]|uniref:Uncharacterized protein n=1 Tax=Babesia ovis TaxID=5869 RepID=A0A9W5TE28_BABOV|nr:hypothetical protein BaOVIS_023210 [Babesia ovis]
MDVQIKVRRCSLQRLLEAFFIGCSLLIGLEQFEMLMVHRPTEVPVHYTYYFSVALCTCVVAIAINFYSHKLTSLSLGGHVLFTLLIYVVSFTPDDMAFYRMFVVLIASNQLTLLLLQIVANYSSNSAPFLAFVCGSFISYKMPYMCKAFELQGNRPLLAFSNKHPSTYVLLQIKVICCLAALLLRYMQGESCGVDRTPLLDSFNRFQNSWNLVPMKDRLKTFWREIWANRNMWVCLCNLAALLALMFGLPPHISLKQLPMSTEWMEEIKSWEGWGEGIGIFMGAMMPLPDRTISCLTGMLFTTFVFHFICAMMASLFSSTSWITINVVVVVCVATCFVTAYTLSFYIGEMIHMFFIRTCKNNGIYSTPLCCDSLRRSTCYCKEKVMHYDCEPRLASTKPPQDPTNHVLWIIRKISNGYEPGCITMKCKCKAECVKKKCGYKGCCKNSPCPPGSPKECCHAKLLEPKEKPKVCTSSPCTKGANGKTTPPCTPAAPTPSSSSSSSSHSSRKNVCLCKQPECKPENAKDPCSACECSPKNCHKMNCAEWVATTKSQHYYIKNAYASTCEDCDLTLLLKGTPIGTKGDVCCLPYPKNIYGTTGWARYNPETDRVYLGYLDAECPICSLVEIRPRCFAKEYNMTIDQGYPNHFVIENLSLGSCCHDGLMVKVQCTQRDRYPNMNRRQYRNKHCQVSFVYFTSAGIMKEEKTEGSGGAGGGGGSGGSNCATASTGAAAAPGASGGKEPLKDLSPLEDYNKCCFGIATRVFAYYNEVRNFTHGRSCLDSVGDDKAKEKLKCCCCDTDPTKDACKYGCCVRVDITDDIQEQINGDVRRFRVTSKFGIIFIVFFAFFMLVNMMYTRPGMKEKYNMAMDINKLKRAVTRERWNREVEVLLYTATSESVEAMEPPVSERMDLARNRLSIFLRNKVEEFEDWVRTLVTKTFTQYTKEEGDARLEAACLAVMEDAIRQGIKNFTDGYEKYLLRWEGIWIKEYQYYNNCVVDILRRHAYNSRMAQSAIYAANHTQSEIDDLHKVRLESWNEVNEEVAFSQMLRKHQSEVEALRAKPRPEPLTLAVILSAIWDGRMPYLIRWTDQKRCLYNWSGFINTYQMYKEMLKYQETEQYEK